MEKIIADAKIKGIAGENPDLTAEFIRDILVAKQEARDGKIEPYLFSDK